MSDQEALINLDEIGSGVQKYDDDTFKEVVTSGGYLARLQLMTSQSNKCKSGDFPINHYALVRDGSHTDVGKEVDILLIAWRPKAIQITDETVIAVFDHSTDQFKNIVEQSEVTDSGCLYGPEFLVWVPSQKSYALFFMGSKSSRRESPNVKALLGKAGTLEPKHVVTKKYEWYTPAIKPCSTPFDTPDTEDLKEQVEKFNNPPVSEVEVAEESGDKSAEERAR